MVADVPVILIAPVLALTFEARLTPNAFDVLPLSEMLPEPVAVTALDNKIPCTPDTAEVLDKLIFPVVVNPTVPVDELVLLMVLTLATVKPKLSTKVTEPVLPASVEMAFVALSKVYAAVAPSSSRLVALMAPAGPSVTVLVAPIAFMVKVLVAVAPPILRVLFTAMFPEVRKVTLPLVVAVVIFVDVAMLLARELPTIKLLAAITSNSF